MSRLQFVPRTGTRRSTRLLITLGAVGVALLLGAPLLWLSGIDPFRAYGVMLRGALGDRYAWSDTAVKATPLILCGLGCALAFRMKLWNVGAEGQLLVGAWAATGVGSIWLPGDISPLLMLPAMALAALAAGGLYAALAGWLRARLEVSEILTTLMLVYVATLWNNYWIFGVWSEGGFPLTPLFPDAARLPRLADLAATWPGLSGLTVHAGFPIALLTAALLRWLLRTSRLGFEIEVVGASPGVARSSGIPVASRTVLVLALSGALAGLAGMIEVSGVVFRLQERFSPGYGFAAIIVAWMARLHPGAVVLAGLLLGGLLVGSREVQPAGIGLMLQGLLLFVVVASELLIRYRPVWRRHG